MIITGVLGDCSFDPDVLWLLSGNPLVIFVDLATPFTPAAAVATVAAASTTPVVIPTAATLSVALVLLIPWFAPAAAFAGTLTASPIAAMGTVTSMSAAVAIFPG